MLKRGRSDGEAMAKRWRSEGEAMAKRDCRTLNNRSGVYVLHRAQRWGPWNELTDDEKWRLTERIAANCLGGEACCVQPVATWLSQPHPISGRCAQINKHRDSGQARPFPGPGSDPGRKAPPASRMGDKLSSRQTWDTPTSVQASSTTSSLSQYPPHCSRQ